MVVPGEIAALADAGGTCIVSGGDALVTEASSSVIAFAGGATGAAGVGLNDC